MVPGSTTTQKHGVGPTDVLLMVAATGLKCGSCSTEGLDANIVVSLNNIYLFSMVYLSLSSVSNDCQFF